MKLKWEHGWYILALFSILGLIILLMEYRTNTKHRPTIKKAVVLSLVLTVISFILILG